MKKQPWAHRCVQSHMKSSAVRQSAPPGGTGDASYPTQIQKLSRSSQACGSCINDVNYVGFNQPWETLLDCLLSHLGGREEGEEGEREKR